MVVHSNGAPPLQLMNFTSWGIYSLIGLGSLPSFFRRSFRQKNHQTSPIDQSCALPRRAQFLKSPRQRVICLTLKNRNPPTYFQLSYNPILGLTVLSRLFVEQPNPFLNGFRNQQVSAGRSHPPGQTCCMRGGGGGIRFVSVSFAPSKTAQVQVQIQRGSGRPERR
jgi:hypothetical protein